MERTSTEGVSTNQVPFLYDPNRSNTVAADLSSFGLATN